MTALCFGGRRWSSPTTGGVQTAAAADGVLPHADRQQQQVPSACSPPAAAGRGPPSPTPPMRPQTGGCTAAKRPPLLHSQLAASPRNTGCRPDGGAPTQNNRMGHEVGSRPPTPRCLSAPAPQPARLWEGRHCQPVGSVLRRLRLSRCARGPRTRGTSPACAPSPWPSPPRP